MTTLYWTCLGGGFALTVLMLIVGEVLEAALDALDGALEGLGVDAFDPLALLAGVTLFGGAGLILDSTLSLEVGLEVALAVLIGIVGAVALHVVYIKPMKQSENSTGFSVQEYAGKTGELATGVPLGGFGEVTVRMGASTTFQTASSFSGDPIPTGTAVVVVEVDPEGVLRVAPLDTDDLAQTVPTPTRLQTRA